MVYGNHLEVLMQGVGAWNEWRKNNPHITPNLKEAKLTEANLEDANLKCTNLRRARLEGANLKGADLRGADLTGAVLAAERPSTMIANLAKTDLRGVIFTTEENVIGPGSFLDLSACIGLETAKFSKTTFLQDYLIKAFEYTHRTDIPETKRWPNFVQHAIQNIKALRSLYADQLLPEQLIKVIGAMTAELIKHLKKHPKALYDIRPRQFEELIAEILASNGWQVDLTPSTRDGGYDIYAISPVSGKETTSWIIECKKYAPENKVGVDLVRALYGLRMDLQTANAMLATTSYFSRDARAYKASRYDLKLYDYEGILEWINEYRPNPNGKLYIKDNKLIVPNE